MKAEELRIRNYVQDEDGHIVQMELTHFSGIFECRLSEDDIYPIPLTEEWLLKFGFSEFMSPSDLRISICNGVLLQFHFGVNQVECWVGDEINKTDLIYVHQLQNLYFALTGEELTIKQ